MNIKAKLLEILSTQQITDKFKKREFVVEYAENPQYPEYIKFELIQDKCGIMDSFSAGDEIDVHFNLKGRKWTDPKGDVKYFNTLQAWRIQKVDGQPSEDKSSNDTGLVEPPAWLEEEDDNQDVPF